jgi:hypothetical protein
MSVRLRSVRPRCAPGVSRLERSIPLDRSRGHLSQRASPAAGQPRAGRPARAPRPSGSHVTGVGGRAAGLISALSAALSYDFFLTTPYHSLRIDSVAQVITVALLFATGLVASFAGRARRRRTIEADTQAGIIRLPNTVTRAAAAGGPSPTAGRGCAGAHQLTTPAKRPSDRAGSCLLPSSSGPGAESRGFASGTFRLT